MFFFDPISSVRHIITFLIRKNYIPTRKDKCGTINGFLQAETELLNVM